MKIFCRFSRPEQLHSDQERQLESELVNEICTLKNALRTTRNAMARYRAIQSDSIGYAAVHYTVGNHQADWQQHIRKLCLAFNSSIHSSTGFSPFFLTFWRQVNYMSVLLHAVACMEKPFVGQVMPSLHVLAVKMSLSNRNQYG